MSWDGTWNGNVFIGTHTVDGSGRVFMGAWTMRRASGRHDPQLSSNDPFFNSNSPSDRSPEHWFGLFGRDGVWRGNTRIPRRF
jgi:hypothetical protein